MKMQSFTASLEVASAQKDVFNHMNGQENRN
jgi:hypothetical protein